MNEDRFNNEEYDVDTQQNIINAVRKSFSGAPLNSGEVSIVFFWQRHKTDPNMQFVKERLRLDKNYELVKRRFWRRRSR